LTFHLFEGDSSAGDFGEDLLGGGGPHERLRVVVVDPQVVLDIGDEFVDAVEHAASGGFIGQVPLAKPPFHQVEPR